MADVGAGAPAPREEILAVLAGPKDRKGYPMRKAIKEWLADDKDGAKGAWLKNPV